ncbi:MAG: CPBP family intramembrane glutamic endopeptidase [Acholeplasmataceae bacterium]|nr:CPBP family intramembrane glutamic endopeptidase [Acholeplasmataceae bacterium]
MKVFVKIISIIVLTVILLGAPKVGTWVANMFDYSSIDPDGAFMWISVHHIIQAVVILLIILFSTKFYKVNFHLNMGNKEVGYRYLKKFMLYFSIYTVIAFIVIIISSGIQPFQYPLNARNISGYLGFQLLLSGPSEELIFRAFAITIFVLLVSQKRIDKHLSYANLFAAIIFGIAHIQFSLSPFDISFALPQVLMAIGLGYFYGDCYEKSKSVVYPMIMHSFSNVLMVGITILLSFFI